MSTDGVHAVTGAFGYSGRYLATRLLEEGKTVITLTNSVNRSNPFAGKVRAFPLLFEDPDRLAASLAGVEVLYNTYWVRFNHKLFTHAQAVENSVALFSAAKRAGVRRLVHVSITNADENSPLEYFAGKGKLERALKESGLSYAILRPTVLFGREDILINNIAWALRHFPFFTIFGDGSYRLQPIHVDDLAELAVAAGKGTENTLINAIGKLVGWMMKDKFITREEIRGLMAETLYVTTPPTGKTALAEWMKKNSATLGLNYASELNRRRDRQTPYF